ncbi:unnamed protein product [Lupinus luteus]|uniref:Uncharacterized protein n=1 Tax=Lupinus luteus TaxID=3873 RepID=A0AAV1WX15_LUPLU
MGRAPCCDKNGLKKGPWTPEEDQKLIDYIQKHGYGNWRTLPKNAAYGEPKALKVGAITLLLSSKPRPQHHLSTKWNTYPSNLNDFGSQQHSQISDRHSDGTASSSAITDNYYDSDYYHTSIIDPRMSETSTFYSNNSNQNFSLASVLSTPISSPKPMNTNSTYINGSSTEDERGSYVTSNILGFEIPDVLGYWLIFD